MVMENQKKQENSGAEGIIRVETSLALDYVCTCGESLGGDDAELTNQNNFKQEISPVEVECPGCGKTVCHKKIIITEI